MTGPVTVSTPVKLPPATRTDAGPARNRCIAVRSSGIATFPARWSAPSCTGSSPARSRAFSREPSSGTVSCRAANCAPLGEEAGDGDLAAAYLAERAGILPGDTNRVAPLLGKTCVVDEQQAGTCGEHLTESSPGLPAIPAGLRDEVLERLILRIRGEGLYHRLHRLARLVAQRTADVSARALLQSRTAEAADELRQESSGAGEQPARLQLVHAS